MAKPDLVMEERLELMVNTDGSNERYRKAHFLPPCATSIDGPVSAPDFAVNSAPNDYKRLPLKPDFPGWRQPKDNWKTWAKQMQSLHHSTWKACGVHDAVINSTYNVQRDDDLIFGLVDKWWCPSTNTFVFPWGEATITLEDVLVIGGFSVLGDSVLSPPGDEETVEKLVRARSSVIKTTAKRADPGKWMTMFMGSGSEIEHEAFLAYWLSRFVFPYWRDTIGTKVFSVAVRLVKGNKIALAPPVLASIYKNLTLLKAAIVAARKEGRVNDVLKITVTAPLLLLQVWVWERFPSRRANPISIRESEPRLARWHNVKKLYGIGDNIDSAGQEFQWRPYATTSEVHMNNAHWVKVGSDLDDDLVGLVRCLRTSELVGLEADCIEQYLPHRVALQFGMDQDLPGHAARVNTNPEVAWRDYCRPIRDVKLYVPARGYEPQVTTRYLTWWKNINIGRSGVTTNREPGAIVIKDNTIKVEVKSEEEIVAPPPGFTPMSGNADLMAEQVGASPSRDESMLEERISNLEKLCAFLKAR